MATFAFSTNGAGGYDMRTWDVGNIIGLIAENFAVGDNTQLTYDSGAMALTIFGSFSNFDVNGDPTAGTITSFTHSWAQSPNQTLTVSGFSLSVPIAFNWIATGNNQALHDFVHNGADTMTGTAFDDYLRGYGGNDVINGGNGNDELYGDGAEEPFPIYPTVPGDDTINGGAGADLLFGQGGADTLNGGADGDTLNGGAGNDTLNGDAGNDLMVSAAGVDVIDGGGDTDSLALFRGSSALNFTLNVAAFATAGGVTLVDGTIVRNVEMLSQLLTGSGADSLVMQNPFTGPFIFYTYDLGAGTDTVSIDVSAASAGVALSNSLGGPAVLSSFSNQVQISNAEQFSVIGAAFSDVLFGGAFNDTISGGGGDDVLGGGGGDDTLTGGAGADSIEGGAGVDTLNAEEGDDTVIYDGQGADQIDAGAGTDALTLSLSLQTAGISLSTSALTAPGGFSFNGATITNAEKFGDIFLGSGSDTVQVTGPGAARLISGGGGFDTLSIDISTYNSSSLFNPTNLVAGVQTFVSDFEQFTILGGSGGDDLLGGGGNDDFSGNANNDRLRGAAGNDTLNGGDGNDELRGGDGDDVLDGGAGDDIVDGGDPFLFGGGADALDGGAGFDTLFYMRPTFDATPFDLTFSPTAIASNTGGALAGMLVRNVEKFEITTLNGDDTVTILGPLLSGQNTLTTGAGVDTLIFDGSALSDQVQLIENFFNIALVVGVSDTLFLVGVDKYQVSGGSGNDALQGGGEADSLSGNAGNDTLNGGADADVLIGGAGNDLYVVDNAFDITTELAGEGTDSVQSNVTWFQFDEVENLTLTGAAAINGSGNALANVIVGNAAANQLFGNAGNDTLDGGAGADQMFGGVGDDLYIVDNVADFAFEAQFAWGLDLVQASVSYTLGQNIDNLTLLGAALVGQGNVLANVITGNASGNNLFGFDGNDTLNGGAGVDSMFGGLGDDLYIVDNAADQTFEAQSTWGNDTAQTSVTYQLGTNIDNLVLQAGAGALTGRGNILNNMIIGNESANTLFGFAGNDTLNGGVGADQLYGREGDDTYIVDNVNDVVSEANAAWGTDTIQASVTYFLAPNLENLTLTGGAAINGNGNTLNNAMTGNSAANNLFGFAGADTLDGGAGADSLFGGEGDDLYIVDNAGDVGFEGNVAWGVDLVQASVSHVLGTNLDNLTLTGVAAINGTGNGLANVITGNGGANTLSGLGGADTLNGGAGNDALDGGAGDDTFLFAPGSNSDTVSGFVAGGAEDSINLSAYNGSGVTWSISQAGADTVFSFSNGDQITLTNVTAANLVQTDPFGYS